jgi:hypothetical protein
MENNLLKLYEDLTGYALDDIVERLLKNEVITSTAHYRIWRLQQMGLHFNKIKHYIAKNTGKTDREIENIFKNHGVKYYKSVREITIDSGDGSVLTLNTSNLMSEVYSYYVASTKGTIKNLTNTVASGSSELLINKLDKVHLSVVSGIQSYSEAINEAINEVGSSQITVKYPGGKRATIESAIRRAVVTGVNKCFTDLNLIRAKESGYNYVLVSSHLGARHIDNPEPLYASHDIWQGKAYSVDYSKVPIMNTMGLI